MNHEYWLKKTVEMASDSVHTGGSPFYAIVVHNGEIIGRGTNEIIEQCDPTAHAELLAIREACKTLQTADLSGCFLYASGEPCPMCLSAAYWANVGEIYYAMSKADAEKEAGLTDPLKDFYADRQKPPADRAVPFHHLRIEKAELPFIQSGSRQD